MIQADTTLNAGRYQTALTTSFIRRGILATSAAVSLARDLQLVPATKTFGVTGSADNQRTITFIGDNQGYRKTGSATPQLQLSPINTRFGLTVHVFMPAEPKRFPMASAIVAAGVQRPESSEEEAQDFIEDLIQLGHVAHEKLSSSRIAIPTAMAALTSMRTEHKTHYLIEEDDKLVLRRHHFDCRIGCCSK